MDTENISIIALFLAGLFSLFTPSVLLLMPPYLAYLSGSNPLGEATRFRRGALLLYAFMFMAGFIFGFIFLFGTPPGVLGGSLNTVTRLLETIGGLLLIVFACYVAVRTLGQIFWRERLAALLSRRVDLTLTGINCLRSIFFGLVFVAGWTPMIGPNLGAVLTLAIQGINTGQALFYLFIYGLGLAIPFIIIALIWLFVTAYLRRLHPFAGMVELFLSSLVLFLIGFMLLTGLFTYLNSMLIRATPFWVINRL